MAPGCVWGVTLCLLLLLTAAAAPDWAGTESEDEAAPHPLIVDDISTCLARNVPLDDDAQPGDAFSRWLASASLARPGAAPGAAANASAGRNSSADGCSGAYLQNISVCSADGGPRVNYSSLTLREGCCSRPCAAALDQALVSAGPGCYRAFLESACNSSASYGPALPAALLGAAQRCLGLNASCAALEQPGGGGGTLLLPDVEARARNGSSAFAAADGTAGAGLQGNNGSAPTPFYSTTAPDPFQLVPSVPADVVLASADEILSVARRRPLSSRRTRDPRS